MLPARLRQALTLGGRVPPEIGGLIALTIFLSLVAAVARQAESPLLLWLIFVPLQVVRAGWFWQLATSTFVELDPFSLLFACLLLYWFGPDLARRWGARRFVVAYAGVAALVNALVCLVAFTAWPPLREHPFWGAWPVVEMMTIAWACYYPEREIRIYFLFPVAGRHLVAVTVAITALYAVFNGVTGFVPHFISEALALAYFFVILPRSKSQGRAPAEAVRRRVKATYLRAVPSDESPPPPKVWN